MAVNTRTSARMTGAQRREQILDAAKRIAAAHGFHSVSIEAVCREAGITRPLVYGHFGDLAGLLDALVARETARGLEQLEAVLPQVLADGDPRERLLGAFEGYLRVAQADPLTWRLALMPPEGAPARLRESVTAAREAVIAMLTQALSDGFGPAGEAPPDAALIARWLSTIADESARLLLTRPDEFSVERAVGAARWALDRLG